MRRSTCRSCVLLPFHFPAPAHMVAREQTCLKDPLKMAEIKDPENTIIITLSGGEVVIELLSDVAPQHCTRRK